MATKVILRINKFLVIKIKYIMEETNFKIIEECPNYAISNEGTIKNIKNGKILKTYMLAGVMFIQLYNNIKHRRPFLIHNLVSKYFLPKPTGFENILVHIDGNKLNNHASNLKWTNSSPIGKFQKNENITEEEKQWVAGFLDGDGCLSLYNKKNKSGSCLLQPFIMFSQAQDEGTPKVLVKIQELYGGSIIKHDSCKKFKNKRKRHQLHIRQETTIKEILNIMIKYSTIKYAQAQFLLDKYKEGRSYDNIEEANEQSEILKNMHHTYEDVKVDENRFSPPYMGGLFDAEGCVCVYTSGKLTVSLSQEGSSQLRKCIVEKYGGTDNGGEVVWCGANAKPLLLLLQQYCTGKLEQIQHGLKYLDYFFVRREPSEIRKRKLDERSLIYSELKRLKKL